MKATAIRIARHLRNAILSCSQTMGLTESVARGRWRQNRLLILCYHGISLDNEHEWDPDLFISPKQLDDRLRKLRQLGCAVLPLGEAVERLKSKTLPAKSVAITFDDGFYNFYAAAAPVLRKYDMPATIYVSTYHCLDQRPVLRPFMRYILWLVSCRGLTKIRLPFSSAPVSVSSYEQIDETSSKWAAWTREQYRDHDERRQSIFRSMADYDIDCQKLVNSRMFGFMSLQEIAELSQQGFDVQLHTHRHRTPRDPADFAAEITTNKEVLTQAICTTPSHFCYPSGDYHMSFLPILRSHDVRSATTCETGLASPDDDPLLLPRFIDTMGQSEIAFVSWVSGVAQFLTRTRALSQG